MNFNCRKSKIMVVEKRDGRTSWKNSGEIMEEISNTIRKSFP